MGTAVLCYLQQVVPFQVPGRKGNAGAAVMTDEALLKAKPDKLRNLLPAFVKPGGTVTTGNSSIIADLTSVLCELQEVVPVQLPGRKGATRATVMTDENLSKVNAVTQQLENRQREHD